MFSLFNFPSIFPGSQLTPFAPMCGRPCPDESFCRQTPDQCTTLTGRLGQRNKRAVTSYLLWSRVRPCVTNRRSTETAERIELVFDTEDSVYVTRRSCTLCYKERYIAESVSDFFKSVNIWQSYKQERDCLVHFLCLLAVYRPGVHSTWDSHSCL